MAATPASPPPPPMPPDISAIFNMQHKSTTSMSLALGHSCPVGDRLRSVSVFAMVACFECLECFSVPHINATLPAVMVSSRDGKYHTLNTFSDQFSD